MEKKAIYQAVVLALGIVGLSGCGGSSGGVTPPSSSTPPPSTTAPACSSTITPSIASLQAAITGKTIGNGDNQGGTVIEIGSNAGQSYHLYQYNNDNTYTTQTGSWTTGSDSNCHPTINLTPSSEQGVTLGAIAIHVSNLTPENSAGTIGATFTGTTNTTALTFNASIPFTSADLSGKTLSNPNTGTSSHNIVFNSSGYTGMDYTHSCNSSGVAFTWSINSSGSLVLDESKGCNGEVFTISLLDKSTPGQYKTAIYATKNATLDYAASPYTFGHN